MAKGYFLGIDGGSTKTAAVLLTGHCKVIARAEGGPSNHNSVGLDVVEASLREAIHQVLAAAGVGANDVTAVGLGMAGVGRHGDKELVEDALSRVARFRHVFVTSDADAALVGGVGRRHGVVLIAGTGAIAYGVNAQGVTARADGWGYRMGNEGGAYWIGGEGLRAAARAHDGRGPTTVLEALLVSHFGVRNLMALVPLVYADSFGEAQQAELAMLVTQAAQADDVVAQGILREAGQWLSCSLSAVIHSLDMTGEAFEVVLMGGVVRVRNMVWETVVEGLNKVAPRAKVVTPRNDAAIGAALLAQQAVIQG